jgi:hypothetical protein
VNLTEIRVWRTTENITEPELLSDDNLSSDEKHYKAAQRTRLNNVVIDRSRHNFPATIPQRFSVSIPTVLKIKTPAPHPTTA